MIKYLGFFVAFALCNAGSLMSQSRRINGDGQLVNKTFFIRQVSEVKLNGSWIKAVIECGKMPLVKVMVDRNIMPFIIVSEKDNVLSIHSGDNWIEPTAVEVRIQIPYLSRLETEGWVDADVKNVAGTSFMFRGEVGSLNVEGALHEIAITTRAAEVNLRQLMAKKITITGHGNGNITYSDQPSIVIKNGIEVDERNESSGNSVRLKDLTITLYNNHPKTARLMVEGPAGRQFSYGFAISPYSKRAERWVEGTKLFLIKSEFEKGDLLFTLSAKDNGQTLKIQQKE